MKFLSRREYTASTTTFYPQINFMPILTAILNFCVKREMHLSLKWCEIEWFGWNFLPAGYTDSHLPIFAKVDFQWYLAAILNFCIKCQSAFISETVWDRVISTNFCICRLYGKHKNAFISETVGDFIEILGLQGVLGHLQPFAKNRFLAISNVSAKCKNSFISEMVWDRAILTKFFTCKA